MMKHLWVVLLPALLVLAIVVPLCGPLVAVAVGYAISWWHPACNELASEACVAVFVRLGQTGDLFGVLTSLFSGLALFSVAITVWFDLMSRRIGRKPLVVCKIDDEHRILFDEPNFSTPPGLRVGVGLEISALNDVALNVVVGARLVAGSWEKSLSDLAVPIPLSSGVGSHIGQLSIRLSDSDIKSLMENYKHSGGLILCLLARCVSLEGLNWTTKVSYVLKFRTGEDKLMDSLITKEGALIQQWSQRATVQPEYEVLPNSWSHERS